MKFLVVFKKKVVVGFIVIKKIKEREINLHLQICLFMNKHVQKGFLFISFSLIKVEKNKINFCVYLKFHLNIFISCITEIEKEEE